MSPSTDQVWRFIAGYVREHSYAPSLREVSAACFMGRSTALRHIDLLAAKGFIDVTPGIARGIAVKAYPPVIVCEPADEVKSK